MTLQTFFVIGGHCPRSKEDAQTIYNYFVANSLKPVKKIQKADLLCIYTCGGFNDTEHSSLYTIQRIVQQKSPHAIVVVTGCLTKINPDSLKSFQNIRVIDLDHLAKLDSLLHPRIPIEDIPHSGIIETIPPLYENKLMKTMVLLRTNSDFLRNIPAYLKEFFFKKIMVLDAKAIYLVRISRGCLGDCAYCSIKLAHGRLKSRSLEEIQKDFEIGLKKGYKIFKLIGHDIGCYGRDIKTNIVELLKLFFTLPGNNKLIITDFHPKWLIQFYEQLEPLLMSNHEKILSFRIPIESGSNTILKRMKRYYNIEDVQRYLSRLQKNIPTLKLYTHIIVGFPGETDEDFQQTLRLLKSIHFSSIGIYTYSDRPMTEAFKMKEKIPTAVIHDRVKQIKDQVPIKT